jgi:hypothetical protein
MCAPSSSLTLLIWVPIRTLRGSGFEPLISRAVAGWQLDAPILIASAGLVGSWSCQALKPLINNPLESRALVATALVEWISRPLVSNRTLRRSDFSSPRLGPHEGHAYSVRDRAIKYP